jgi:hypothetical protein
VRYDRWPDDVEHVWTHADRLGQLSAMQSLCRRMAELFASNRDPRAAELVSGKAAAAARLLQDGFTQADLDTAFGGSFPPPVSWLHPKAEDFGAPRGAWQDEVAALYQRAAAVATDLHSVATLRRR